MKILLIIILVFSSTVAFAQNRKLRWSTETCEFEGTYNAKKYSEKQLRDTLKLFATGNFRIEANATPLDFEGVEKLSVAALDAEYNSKSAGVRNLNLIKSPYWEAVRQKKLNELEQVYKLSRATMLAYKNPAMIRDYANAPSCVKTYANSLINGGSELLAIWRRVNEDGRRKNADPERVRRIFDQQLNSPDKYKYAQIEVMTYGWWNCANEFIQYEEGYDRQQKEFKKLFTRVRTIGCDEP